MYPERVILNNCTEFILVLVFSIILVFLLAGHGTKGLYQIKAKLWGFSTRHWRFAIVSTLVAVASLIKWELVRTGFSHMSSRQYQE